ncbi:MAG: heme exporter protein CcmD [Hyphomicrobiales bacterium]|uniref:heme exporter protein CcmD n=1 Tax=Aestuariivirga sp. TaxID=2650926 RepID=UPI0035B1044F
MDFSANHIGYVIASYALSFVVLAGLIITTLGRDRKLRAEAERLDTERRKARA